MITSSKFIVWFVIVAIVVFGGVYFFYSNMSGLNTSGNKSPGLDPVVQQLMQQRQAGDYAGVVSGYESTVNDPNKSSSDKASAAIMSAGAEFHLTGDINARVQDVQRLKAAILDPTISLRARVSAINTLASQYRDSGRDPLVFQEMYKGPPFENYLAPSDPELSARHLFEWSYAQFPTAEAAISIAKWYSEQNAFDPTLSKETKKSYAASAEDYLKKADAAEVLEEQNDPAYMASTNYLIYRTFKTYVIGRLARQVGEPYESQYRKEFDEFFTYAQGSSNVLAAEYILYARFTYAIEMYYDNDSPGAKVQLDLLAKEIDALEKPNTHGFVRFLINTHENQPTGANWTVMPKLFAISPTFKTTVERTLASAPQATSGTSSEPILDGY